MIHSAPSRPTLRRWQAEALPLALASLQAADNGLIAATTGSGKSVLLAELIRCYIHDHPDARIVVTTPTVKLVEQLGATISDWIGPGMVGRFFTAAKQWRRQVVVCCNPSAGALAALWTEAGWAADVWIADEAHKTESGQMLGNDASAVAGAVMLGGCFPDARRLGMTATPFRAAADAKIRLFDRVIYRYPPAEALRDGVIVPWQIVGWDDQRADVTTDEACVTMIRDLGPSRGPGVVNAATIADADAYCVVLGAAGIRAAPVHSRQPASSQAATLARLKAGDIDCIVHVAMLVEGIDLPWLRWICLRRVVGSRVRFVQEIGRVLRASPGKHHAVVLDPNDLFGSFSLSYEEALGWSDPAVTAAKQDKEDEDERANCADTPGRDPVIVQAARTSAVGRYARQIMLALQAEGIAAEMQTVGSSWRSHPASARQIKALTGSMARPIARVALDHRAAIRQVIAMSDQLTKGIASDLFEIFSACRRLPSGGEWTPASPVRIPCADAFAAPLSAPSEPVPVYVAAAMRGGHSALAIVRQGVILYDGCRPSKPGDRWDTITERGIEIATKHAPEEIRTHDAQALGRFGGPHGYCGVGLRECTRAENPAERVAWAAISKASRAGVA